MTSLCSSPRVKLPMEVYETPISSRKLLLQRYKGGQRAALEEIDKRAPKLLGQRAQHT